ncbi:MAG: tetratricopeptide (TPR) repeat protein, partial [Gammaproteobacteria bacterium]
YEASSDKGLVVALGSRWDEAWEFPSEGARFAYRHQPASPAVNNSCAPCHARRATLAEQWTPGAPLAQSHRLAVLTPPLYFPDGQQRDEVFVWGSFAQSRMYQKGVTCVDCHEPHTAGLREKGNALCSHCHAATHFDTPEHHFHKTDSLGAQCVECHMPAQNYMVVDARRDHSMRIPRPDLSHALGAPNACNQCHTDRDSEWAAASMDQWYGTAWRERANYGKTLHAGTTKGVGAAPELLKLAEDNAVPALVRATSATLLQPYMRRDLLMSARLLLKDPDPDVRIAALGLIEPADPVNRVLAVAPLLEDAVLGVRVEAARILADVPENQLPENRRGAFRGALDEYVAGLLDDADWPTANANLGNLYARQGQAELAIGAYERALALDPEFAAAYGNLADLYRALGQEEAVVQVLNRGLAKVPGSADLHHALGLALVRDGDRTRAVAEFEQAARLAPGNGHYAYVHAVALHSIGQIPRALEVLHEADVTNPNTSEILGTLVSMYREAGDIPSALIYARRLSAALPEDPTVRQLLSDLEGAH